MPRPKRKPEDVTIPVGLRIPFALHERVTKARGSESLTSWITQAIEMRVDGVSSSIPVMPKNKQPSTGRDLAVLLPPSTSKPRKPMPDGLSTSEMMRWLRENG